MKQRITPQEAGRRGGLIGGKSKSPAKLAACRRNGFQRAENLPPLESAAPAPKDAPVQTAQRLPLLLTVSGKENG